MPTAGVIRFLHLMINILAHKAVVHVVNPNTFSTAENLFLQYDQTALWNSISFLGVRAWVDVIEKPWDRLGWPTVDVLHSAGTQVRHKYVMHRWDVVYWYYTDEMRVWRVKRVAAEDRQDSQPLGSTLFIFKRDEAEDLKAGEAEQCPEDTLGDAQDAPETESRNVPHDAAEGDWPEESERVGGDSDGYNQYLDEFFAASDGSSGNELPSDSGDLPRGAAWHY